MYSLFICASLTNFLFHDQRGRVTSFDDSDIIKLVSIFWNIVSCFILIISFCICLLLFFVCLCGNVCVCMNRCSADLHVVTVNILQVLLKNIVAGVAILFSILHNILVDESCDKKKLQTSSSMFGRAGLIFLIFRIKLAKFF